VVAKNVEFFVCLVLKRDVKLQLTNFCLSVCLSVTLLNVRDCAPDSAMKVFEYRNDVDAVG